MSYCRLSIKSVFHQFREKDVVRDCVKGFTDVQIGHIVAFPLSSDTVTPS